jgi:hypothetical protein
VSLAPAYSMAKTILTKSTVDKLAPSAEDYVIWDSALPGFGIRVKPSNVKSYIIQYRNRKTGASRRKTIGKHGPLLTFHKAKERARILLADALKGNDPVADDRATREAPTMRHLTVDYLEQHAVPKKRPRSVGNDRSMINRIILPRLGNRKVAAIQSRDIHLLHVSMKSTPYEANRVLALLSKMFSLAAKWGWRSDNPVKGIERFQEKRRERWVSDDELCRLLAVLANHQNQRAANAVLFQLLTGARLGEVLKARWPDIDFGPRSLDQTVASYEAKANGAYSTIRAGARAACRDAGKGRSHGGKIYLQETQPDGLSRISRSSGGRRPRRLGSVSIGFTTTDTPMRPILFQVASVLK